MYFVCDLDNGELIRGCDSIIGYRTYATCGFAAIVAYSKDCGARARMAAYVVSGPEFYGGRMKLFGNKLIVSNEANIELVFPACKVEQFEMPF